jgi:glycosyltransferase involved in cell wall biosynthesis
MSTRFRWPLDASLRELARTHEMEDAVIFTGFRSEIPQITAAIDVAVLPSAFEGMGRVVLEAMAAGKPVVASDVGAGFPILCGTV